MERTAIVCAIVMPFLAGCALFNPNPPLPRNAEIQIAITPARADELGEIIRRAEIFYLPTDRVASGRGGGAGLRVLNGLRRGSEAVAVGFSVIESSDQPLLDQWIDGRAPVETMPATLNVRSELEREECRAFLDATRENGARLLALHCSDSKTGGRACTADSIVRQFRALNLTKLLVVADRNDLETARGLPYFVAQRLPVRQLILDSAGAGNEPARLMTSGRGGLQVVDRPPGS